VGRHEVIVADTHALIWWATNSPELSGAARAAMRHNVIAVAAITFWEIALLSFRRRIAIGEDVVQLWMQELLELPAVTMLPLTPQLAVAAARLPDTIRDPADRLIVATAYQHQVPLVTKDGRIRAANVVPTIW
jgi:PIN domain nuclease of toxin-antitoxin system